MIQIGSHFNVSCASIPRCYFTNMPVVRNSLNFKEVANILQFAVIYLYRNLAFYYFLLNN